MKDIATQPTIFGWPLFLMLAAVFLLNFILCRMVTARLLKKKFIKRNSEETQKAFIMWFFPIIGFAGLLMLLFIKESIKFWKLVSKWLLLKHI